jgi:hypothetical protein
MSMGSHDHRPALPDPAADRPAEDRDPLTDGVPTEPEETPLEDVTPRDEDGDETEPDDRRE